MLNNPLKYTDPSGWLTEVEKEEERLKAQRAAEERMKAGKSMLDWYAQNSGVGADGLTNEQWMNLGGQGVLSPLYKTYINQNRDALNSALNYVMQQNASFTEQLTAKGINPYGKFGFTFEEMAGNIDAIKELRMLASQAYSKISDIEHRDVVMEVNGMEAYGSAEMMPDNSWKVSLSMTRIVTNLDFAYTIGHEFTHILNMGHMNYTDYNSMTSAQLYQEELNVWTNFNQVYGDPNAQAGINYYQNLLKK